MQGSLAEIVAETLVVINNIYRGIEQTDVEGANMFKNFMCNSINDPDATPFANRDDETE